MAERFDKYYRRLSGKSGGVHSDSVSIAGAGVIQGGVYDTVKASGSLRVNGPVKAREFKCAGSARIEGGLEADLLSVSGDMKVLGDMKGGLIKVAGSLSVEGSVRGDDIRVAGSLRAGEVEGDVVRLSGSFRVDGVLKGNYVALKLSSDSEAGSIEGREVYIKSEEKVVSFLGVSLIVHRKRSKPVLRVGRISAKKLHVQGVIVEGDVEAEEVYTSGGGEIRGRVIRP